MQWEYTYTVSYLSTGRKFWDEWEKWFQTVLAAGQNGWEMCGYSSNSISGATGTVGMWVMALFKGPLYRPAETKQCPRCAEDVKLAAFVCRYCGYAFPEPEPEARAEPGAAPPDPEPQYVAGGERVVDVVEHAFGTEWGRLETTGQTVYRGPGTEWVLYVKGETSLVPPPGY